MDEVFVPMVLEQQLAIARPLIDQLTLFVELLEGTAACLSHVRASPPLLDKALNCIATHRLLHVLFRNASMLEHTSHVFPSPQEFLLLDLAYNIS